MSRLCQTTELPVAVTVKGVTASASCMWPRRPGNPIADVNQETHIPDVKPLM